MVWSSPPPCRTRSPSTSPRRVRPGIDVVFLDTGYHFAETIGMRDAVSSAYPVTFLLNITPKQTVAEQDATYGKELWRTDPVQVLPRCAMSSRSRRRWPPTTAWISGLRLGGGRHPPRREGG